MPATPSEPTVLIVLPDLPLVEGGAMGRFFVGLLRGLRANGVDVRAIAARRAFTPPGEVPSDLPVEIVAVEDPPRWRSRGERVLRPMGGLSWGAFARRIEVLGRGVDAVHLESVHVGWCARRTHVPSTLHLHYLAHLDRPYGAPWNRQFWQVTEETVAEQILARRHRHLIANSPVVAAELLKRAPAADTTVSPLCLAPEHYRTAPVGSQMTAGIVGTASWPPTAAAIGRLLTRIWPTVRREIPGAELAVAGRGTRRLVPAPPAGVRVLGEISSGADFLHGLGVLVYPVRRGSGMKVKVLEALATGVPVVTTPAGAEGVEPNPGVVVVEDDAAIARATVSLLQDEAERVERGAAALETFRARYAPEVATRPLADLLAAVSRKT